MKKADQTVMFVAYFLVQIPFLINCLINVKKRDYSLPEGGKNLRLTANADQLINFNFSHQNKNKKQGSHTMSLAFL